MKTMQDVMSQPVRVVPSTEVVGTVRDLMIDHHGHGVPVVGADGTLVGIVTGSDLVEEHPPELGVQAVMSHAVETVSPFTSVVDAARRMRERSIHHLVVVQGDEVVGVVTSFDLLAVLAGELEAAASPGVPARRSAKVGDEVVIRGHAVDRPERRGVISEVRGADGGPPYVVHWLDDPHETPHDVLFFPGSDADVEPAGDPDDRSAEGGLP